MIEVYEKIKKFLFFPRTRFGCISNLGVYNSLPDKVYLSKMFKAMMGTDINWNKPKSFNEKLQWLKVNDRKDEYSVMVDKYLVRNYIKEKIGEEYLIPLIGVYDKPSDIDFDKLPEQYVIKCNHNSGKGMYICKDKSKLSKTDIVKIKKELKKGLKQNYYIENREWAYKNVPRKIIIEKFMRDEETYKLGKGLIDYKFYCFNGEPRYLYVSQDLDDCENAKISFLNMDWTLASFGRNDYPPLEKIPDKPVNYEKMIEIAKVLSKNMLFIRVDLYEINKKIYFGELTFSPCAGMMPFNPVSADYKLGELLQI